MSIWTESIAVALDEALSSLATAVDRCDERVWRKSMWDVPARDPELPLTGPGGELVIDPAYRLVLVQRFSTPWSISWHTLEVLDFDLAGGLETWAGPPPFTNHPHWRDFTSLTDPWDRRVILDYVEHCRQRARITFEDLTDATAGLVSSTHRRPDTTYARILTGLVVHTVEHSAQITQFAQWALP